MTGGPGVAALSRVVRERRPGAGAATLPLPRTGARSARWRTQTRLSVAASVSLQSGSQMENRPRKMPGLGRLPSVRIVFDLQSSPNISHCFQATNPR